MAVAEIQSGYDLPEELPGLFGSEPALLHQVVKQLSTGHMLQHKVPVRVTIKTMREKSIPSSQNEK